MLDILKQKGLAIVRDIGIGLAPLLIGFSACAALMLIGKAAGSEGIVILGILAFIAIPILLYKFVPAFSPERNHTVLVLHGIAALVWVAAVVIAVGIALHLFFGVAERVSEDINDWSVERSEAKLIKLRECYRDPDCSLSANELAELKRLEEQPVDLQHGD